MKKLIVVLVSLMMVLPAAAQDPDSLLIKKIFDDVLTHRDAYQNLEHLCTQTPGRLLGSEASLQALDYMKQYAGQLGVDRVYLQEFTTPAWTCNSASVQMHAGGEAISLHCDALGPSAATPPEGITAEVVEVKSLDEVDRLGREGIEGKIVFYNRPWDQTKVMTFMGYGDNVDQRYHGPEHAVKYGAAAVLVRSATNAMDQHPHTGSTHFEDKKLPAVAISTMDADLLGKTLHAKPDTRVTIKVDARDLEEVTTYNLIAELRGHELPDEYIVVGGHIDAWHNTQGAHDDGAGCVQAMEVLRLFKALGIKNKRTIRAIMYMDEELYQSGGDAYAASVEKNHEKHLFALESDAGAFTPRRFTVNATPDVVARVKSFEHYLKPYGICSISAGWGGVDIDPLKVYNIPLAAYGTDSQRYFEMHHSPNDTFDKVNFRELQLGSGNMAALIYLVDKYGLGEQP